MDWKIVLAVEIGMISDTTKIASSFFIIPFAFISSTVFLTFPSMSSERSVRRGVTPHCKLRAICVLLSFVKANIGGFGRLRERRDAIFPCLVYTNIASTPRLSAGVCNRKLVKIEDKQVVVYIKYIKRGSTHFHCTIADLLSNLIW